MLFQWFSFISCNFYAQNLVKNHWKTFRKPFQNLSKINSKIIQKSLKNLSKNLSKTSPKTSPKPLQKPLQNLSKNLSFSDLPKSWFLLYIYISFWSNLVWHWNGKRVQLLNLYYDKELEGRLVSNATIDKTGLTTCFHLASICLCACVLPFSTSASRSLDTRVFFLLDIGFADAWHRLRVILDIGFALALTTL